MANAKIAKATGSKVATKVSKKFVAKLNEFVEVRSMSNLYEKLLKEGRAEIFAEVGETEQVLVHNGVEVAIIAKVVKPDIQRLFRLARLRGTSSTFVRQHQRSSERGVGRKPCPNLSPEKYPLFYHKTRHDNTNQKCQRVVLAYEHSPNRGEYENQDC
jgi:hypothetical protein